MVTMIVIENTKYDSNGNAIGEHHIYREDIGNGLDREINRHYDINGNLFATSYGIRSRRTDVYLPHRERGPAVIKMITPDVMELTYYRYGINYNPDGHNCIKLNKSTGDVIERKMLEISYSSYWTDDAWVHSEERLYEIYRKNKPESYLVKTKELYDKLIEYNKVKIESLETWIEVSDSLADNPLQYMYKFEDQWSLDYSNGCIEVN